MAFWFVDHFMRKFVCDLYSCQLNKSIFKRQQFYLNRKLFSLHSSFTRSMPVIKKETLGQLNEQHISGGNFTRSFDIWIKFPVAGNHLTWPIANSDGKHVIWYTNTDCDFIYQDANRRNSLIREHQLIRTINWNIPRVRILSQIHYSCLYFHLLRFNEIWALFGYFSVCLTANTKWFFSYDFHACERFPFSAQATPTALPPPPPSSPPP